MIGEIIDFTVMGDDRGSLVALEVNHNVPFDVKRVYYIYGTQLGVRRGLHAHRNLNQLIICLRGSCRISLDDGKKSECFLLDTPDKGLLIEGLIWREMFDFIPGSVLMVIADDYYNEEDYIRDYDVFMNEANR